MKCTHMNTDRNIHVLAGTSISWKLITLVKSRKAADFTLSTIHVWLPAVDF
jgi:hypothetical protein